MDYKLLDHDEYIHPDHPPAESLGVGDTVILAFKGLEGYQVTEARLARVISAAEGGRFVGELVQPGMMIPVAVGERIDFELCHAFEPPPFGDETLFGRPDV